MTQDNKATRLSKIAMEFNVGIATIVEFLNKKGIKIDPNPNTKIPSDLYNILVKEYSSEISVKKESEKLNLKNLRDKKESVSLKDIEEDEDEDIKEGDEELLVKDTVHASKRDVVEDFYEDTPKLNAELKVVGKIDLDFRKKKKTIPPKEEEKEQGEIKKESDSTGAGEKPVETIETRKSKEIDVKVVGKIDLDSINQKTKPDPKKKEEKKPKGQGKEVEITPPRPIVEKKKVDTSSEKIKIYKSKIEKLTGPTVVGKINLPVKEDKRKPVASSNEVEKARKKKKRKRILKETAPVPVSGNKKGEERSKFKVQKRGKKIFKKEVNEEDVQKQIKETLARLTTKGKSKGSKHRREKRDAISQKYIEEQEKAELEKNVLKVTEFVSVNELSSMMNVPATQIISTCMSLGLFVSINQRLDAETMALVADEFNYTVEFVSVEVQEAIKVEEDNAEDLKPRPPIVTVMGHVDHGKTSLLDFIRHSNVIAGEAGGITQHIGAYSVDLDNGRKITFLDTPGHEAFTAMRARGAQITDIAIIVVAADDNVMPQTIEAINHAHAAGVPIVFAINKIDKPGANPEKIKEELAKMNFLVEDWGGKYQSQEISAKKGINIDALLEKVLLETDMLDLKANPDKKGYGAVVESSLDKGRGYVATVLVKAGTLKVGDVVLAGSYTGHIKAIYNERGKKIDEAGPAIPALILGLNGAPQAGDQFNVMDSDKEAKEIANKREQLQREQGLRTQKHITLDEIGRRIAIGNFQELNVIVKGDVDGSVEALSDSLIKLSTEEIQVNIIHKAVGQISESDVLLAAASNAIIIGFQVRPSMSARKLAEKEEIDIRLYSIIYDAINELKGAMEGMLSPEIKEEIVCTLEIRETFKITKVGTIAGCIVKEGKINRNTKVRIIREGIVVYTGELGSLKRFKDDVKEVQTGYECGLNIANFNDIKVGDIIEGYEQVEVKKKL